MSFYNLINGVNPAAFFILPMLGKHPDEYPRFRDCFLRQYQEESGDSIDCICIYTRTGGGNRDAYEDENSHMQSMDGFLEDRDDDFDCTYASWLFRVPDRWKDDLEKIKSGNLLNISKEYQAEIRRVYPKLNEKLNEIFIER